MVVSTDGSVEVAGRSGRAIMAQPYPRRKDFSGSVLWHCPGRSWQAGWTTWPGDLELRCCYAPTCLVCASIVPDDPHGTAPRAYPPERGSDLMLPSSTSPSLDVRNLEDRTVVRFVGCDSLNEFNSDDVGRQLIGLVQEQGLQHLIVDLTGIRYATSTALGRFVGLNRALRTAGGRLVLLNPSPMVAEALEVTRLNTLLEVRPDVEDVGS